MLIKRIALRNIRSYNDGEEAAVDIPEGTILFEGDIGSGKSSLLYALEFALFGFSDMRGAHLLSEGKKDGHVEVTFTVGGKDYLLRRNLKRKGADVVQDDCMIEADGRETKLSPSDLKQRVVALLKFNEPTHPKAESLVYRYAVFTPQEQMKEILLQNADHRLQVIRRVLGAQSYQVAAENSEVVAKKVGEMSYGLRKASDDLEETKSDLGAKSRTLADLDARLPLLVAEESKSSATVERLESEWKGLRDKHEQMSKTTGKIPALERQIRGLESQEDEDEEEIEALERRLKEEIGPKLDSFAASEPPQKDSAALESEHEETSEELQQLRQTKAVADSQLKDLRQLVSQGICPVCGQNIPLDFAGKSDHAEEESRVAGEKIARLEAVISSLSDRVRRARKFEEAERDHSRLSKEKVTVDKELSHLTARAEKAQSEIARLKAELNEAVSEGESMKEVSELLAKLDGELRGARAKSKNAGETLAEARARRSEVSTELDKLSKVVEQKEVKRTESRRLGSYQSWLQDFFRPTVEMIEEQTLTQANLRFNQHFQRFFTSLVDDPEMLVRVKEDFSPVFERQGFEQDYEALSGGERTSMALAYRFALNSVVREDISAQTELVILDEPTDGFSKEQVYKMRDLLEELDSRQVILVSHEKELESMADHIFRIEKTNGTSKISKS